MFRVVMPGPAVFITAATILGTATFVAVPLLAQSHHAQNGEAAKPADPGKAESGKPDAAKPESAKPDAARQDSGKADAAKPESGKPEPGKPDAAKADPAKGGESAKADAAKGEPAKGEPAKGDAAKADPAKEASRSAEAEARTLAGPAGRGECVWLGERAIGLMWKDDLDTAFRHLELYDRFGCPGEHIQVGFRCVVRQGNVQKDPKIAALFDDRVHACWLDPARPAEPANPTAAAVEKPGTK